MNAIQVPQRFNTTNTLPVYGQSMTDGTEQLNNYARNLVICFIQVTLPVWRWIHTFGHSISFILYISKLIPALGGEHNRD